MYIIRTFFETKRSYSSIKTGDHMYDVESRFNRKQRQECHIMYAAERKKSILLQG